MDDVIDEGGEYNLSMNPKKFVAIYLFFVKKGNSSFKYKVVPEIDKIHIGGYGMFL